MFLTITAPNRFLSLPSVVYACSFDFIQQNAEIQIYPISRDYDDYAFDSGQRIHQELLSSDADRMNALCPFFAVFAFTLVPLLRVVTNLFYTAK